MSTSALCSLSLTILFGALVSGTPLLFSTVGEIIAERSGVMNLGLDGMMLIGAVSAFAVWFHTDSLWLGLLIGTIAGGILALLHACITITLQADQVVSGLAVTFLGAGLSRIMGAPYVGQKAPAATMLVVPVLERVALQQVAVVVAGLVLVPLLAFYLYHTRPGLNLRSVGNYPAAADSLGLDVFRTRYLYVVFGGLMSGFGGAAMSLITNPGWVDGKTSGLGWIAVGLVIFAGWDPMRGMGVSYLFGLLKRLPLDLQNPALPLISTANNPSLGRIMDMLPYLSTILVLILWSRGAMRRRLGAPAALGAPYVRGQRGL